MNANLIALNLLESTVTLYPADATGAPILASPIWTGVTVENLVVRERWLKGETRPTGAQYPKRHPLIQQYELSLGRVWSLQLPTTDGGFVPGAGYYVLDTVWQDSDSFDWHREVFYNVSISERSRASRDIESGFTDEQIFDAEFMAPPSGGNGTPPAITGTLPMLVRYIAAGETDLDGVVLYAYDAASHTFTEATAGITTGRATLAYTGTAGAQVFNLTFSGVGTPALQVEADGGLVVSALRQGAPDLSQTPRVDFYYGTQRLASVTAAGLLFATSFSNGALSTGPGKFCLYGGGNLAVTIAAAGVVSGEFEED